MGRIARLTLVVAISACHSNEDVEPDCPAMVAPPTPSPVPNSSTDAGFRVLSFDTPQPVVAFGDAAVLAWSIEGAPDTLTLDGVSVLGSTRQVVRPVRRQTFVLEGRKGSVVERRTVTVAARGIDGIAGVAESAGSLDGPLDHATLERPSAVARAPDGSLVVADNLACTLRRVTPLGMTTIAGAAGDCKQLGPILGLSIADDGLVYLADGYAVRTVDASGAVKEILHGAFANPTAVAALPGGGVAVADAGARDLKLVDKDGKVATSPTTLGLVYALARAPGGDFYVSDACTIRHVDADGNDLGVIAGGQCDFAFDGPATTARFGDILGMTVAPTGEIYVSDGSIGAIRRVAKGQVKTIAQRFASPYGLTFADGQLYVADGDAHVVRAVTVDGVATILAGRRLPLRREDGPYGQSRTGPSVRMSREESGAVIVSDSSSHAIRRLETNGSLVTITDDLMAPQAITTGAGGVFLTELSGAVRRLDGASAATLAPLGSFARPYGIARDSRGNLIVADDGALKVIHPDRSITVLAGTGTPGQVVDGKGPEARVSSPRAFVMDAEDNLYFADAGFVLRRASPDGTVTTIAGVLGQAGLKDGEAHAALFGAAIEGLALARSGDLFVSDTTNHVIRKITKGGAVSTVAGTPGVRGLVVGALPGSFYLPGPIEFNADGDLLVSSGAGIVQITALENTSK